MMDVPVLKARKQPRQLRSQITVTAILDATTRVLLARGYMQCTTNLVAEVAGVGIGSLYEYFPNKEALVAAVIERETDAFTAALKREVNLSFERPLPEAVRGYLSAALDELEARRELLRVLFRDYPYISQITGIIQLPKRMAELCEYSLQHWGDAVSIPRDPATYYVMANMFGGAYLAQVLRPVTNDRAAVLDALTEIMLRVLQPRFVLANEQVANEGSAAPLGTAQTG